MSKTDAIIWCLDKNYIECCKVSVYSFFEQTDPSIVEDMKLCFVVPSDQLQDISAEMNYFIEAVKDIFAVNDIKTYYYAPVPSVIDSLNYDARLSKAASYRLLIPEMMIKDDISKALYVDCDTMFLSNPQDLLYRDMHGFAISAKRDLEAIYYYSDESMHAINKNRRKDMFDYFNDGVMLLDMQKFDKVAKTALDVLKTNPKHGEQDALNAVIENAYDILPNKYNHFTERDDSFWGFTDKPVIVHFIMARNKPWLHEELEDKYSVIWKQKSKAVKSLSI